MPIVLSLSLCISQIFKLYFCGLCYDVYMKTRGTNKLERRVSFRNWRRHIGASKRVQFEESRRKITLQEEVPSSLLESLLPDLIR